MPSEKEHLLRERDRIDARLEEIARAEAEQALHKDVTIDGMTPELWRTMTEGERVAWTNYWRFQGYVSFQCILCGFPTAHGQAGCEVCDAES